MSPAHENIPEGVIERLPSYLSALIQLRQAGQSTVSSARLAELTDVNSAQIRRDLTHFGSFGRRGIGYDIITLIDHVQKILGTDHTHRIALVGAGNLGTAIAKYDGLSKHGFLVTAIFDVDPAKVGTRIGDTLVQHVQELAKTVVTQSIRIGVIAVPPEAAQSVADDMGHAGIQVILNYTPVIVDVPDTVTLHNTDPVLELLHTLHYLPRVDPREDAQVDGVART